MSRQAEALRPKSDSPIPGAILQRKCACGQHPGGGECFECRRQRPSALHRVGVSSEASGLTPSLHEVMQSSGQPLEPDVRDLVETRFGYDFSQVRVHRDDKAAVTAKEMNALAYTVGSHIVFAAGMYAPRQENGLHLLSHELVHVIQQGGGATAEGTPVESLGDGVQRLAVAPFLDEPSGELEQEAELASQLVVDTEREAPALERLHAGNRLKRPAIQPYRVGLPRSVPLCGRTLTHIDIEPPRTRPLAHCGLSAVTRMNIVGRQVSSATTGRGRMIFNLHIGYYRDPTGHLCAIVDDSMACVAGRCQVLGCFPTMREVLDALKDFLWNILKIVGIIILAIIIAIILRGFRGSPGGAPAPSPALARSDRDEGEGEPGGEGAVAEA